MKRFLVTLLAATAAADSNIVQLAEATPDLSTLVTAVSAGGLVNTLESPGPFTVFAPTNEAFAALPTGVVANLLKPENKAALDDVLTYHVVSGAVHAKDLSNGQTITTFEGKTLLATVNTTGVFINDAQVTTANVDASNGVVHIIDAVLLPAAPKTPTPPPAPAGKTIVDLAAATPDLSTLVTALKAGDLVDTLSGPGPFTVFAPTNEAFAALPKALLDYLLDPKHKAQLVDVLTYHVASGSVHAKDLKDHERIKTVEGKDVEAHIFDSKVFINEAQVTTADVDASNGVVHIINAVLIPSFIETKLRANTTPISLARFDGGATDFKWVEENDPVMGGVSTNCTFSTTGDFVGVVEIVPSLKAPGFCFARTSTSKKDFADVSSKTALEIEYTAAVDYTGFKAAFAADTLIAQFESFKADFNVTAGSTVATIPFNSFSNKWSSATGEPTKKSPPTAKNLRDISQLQIWAEGVQGPFQLSIKEIRAV